MAVEVGPVDDLTGVVVDAHGDHHHSLVGEMGPVAEDTRLDVAQGRAVQIDISGGNRPTLHLGLLPPENHLVAVLEHVDMGNPHLPGQIRIGIEVPVLPVDGDECLGPDQVDEGEELVPAGMTRDVDVGVGPVHHLRPAPDQVGDDLGHRGLVARDRFRRDQHRVAVSQFDELVPALGHQGQGGEGLTLAAGRDQ